MYLNVNQPKDFNITTVNHKANITDPISINTELSAEPNQRVKIDLSHLATTDGINNLQTIFIDNYGNDGDVIINIDETNQTIVCKANKQGYFPILAFTRLKLTAHHNSSTAKKIPFYFLNFIVSQGSW